MSGVKKIKSVLKKLIVLLLVAVMPLNFFCACGDGFGFNYFEKTKIIVKDSAIYLYAKLMGKDSEKAYNEMIDTLSGIEKQISLSDENTPLYKFNESLNVDEKIEVDFHTYNMIKMGIDFEKETNGYFSIASFNLLSLWHTTTKQLNAQKNSLEPLSFDLPDDAQIESAKSHCNIDNIVLTETADGKYYLSKTDAELKIDLGAIAKGYMADICKSIAEKYEIESGLIDITGNLVFIGQEVTSEGKLTPWQTGIVSPRPKRVFLSRELSCAFTAGDGVTVVSSGDYERYAYYKNDTTSEELYLCHIMNPILGIPAGIKIAASDNNQSENKQSSSSQGNITYQMSDSTISSATIFCTSSAKADAYSTAVFAMGIEKGTEFLKQKQQSDSALKAILFSENSYKIVGNTKILLDETEVSHDKNSIIGNFDFLYTDIYNEYLKYEQYA